MSGAAPLDLVVVGGGPVGLAAGLYAVRAGLSVTVLEPRPAPLDKACGEGLMPPATRLLAELGVHPRGRAFTGIRYLHGARSVSARFRSGDGLGVRRTELHRALGAAAAAAGVEVLPLALASLEQDAAGVTVATRHPGRAGGHAATGPALRARYVVAADGLHSPTRRLLGLAVPAGGERRHGLRRHYAVAAWTDHVEVHWGAGSEAYVTPVADDLVGVAVLTSRRAPWPELLAGHPLLLERITGAEPAGRVLGAGPLRQRVRAPARGRVLLAGDAAGYVDALTGEGISIGLGHARAAVRAVAAGEPDGYRRDAIRIGRASTVLTKALVAATGTAAGRTAVLETAVRAPRLFGAAVHLLTR